MKPTKFLAIIAISAVAAASSAHAGLNLGNSINSNFQITGQSDNHDSGSNNYGKNDDHNYGQIPDCGVPAVPEASTYAGGLFAIGIALASVFRSLKRRTS
jgi:hypothetical protein